MGEKQGGVWQAGGQRLHGVYAPRELVYTPEASGLTSLRELGLHPKEAGSIT